MAVFAVHYEDDEDLGSILTSVTQLQEAYPQHFGLSERLFLVRSDGTAENVAKSVGIFEGESGASGIVFKLNAAYWGFAKRSVWEWLAAAESA